MAFLLTSGEVNLQESAGQTIAAALRLCSAIADDETPTAAMAMNALDTMNAMVIGWQASGIHVWAQEEAILFQTPEQPRYQLGSGSPDHACLFAGLLQTTVPAGVGTGATSVTLGAVGGIVAGWTVGVQLDSGQNFWTTASGAPTGLAVPLTDALPGPAAAGSVAFAYAVPLLRPMRVPACRSYDYRSRIQNPYTVLSRLDYDYLPNPFNTGSTTQFFYDPQTGDGVYNSAAPIGIMNLWPAPSDNRQATRFVSQRPLQGFNSLANVPDFPPEWRATIRWNLAVEIAPEYDVPAERMQVLKEKAAEWWLRCTSWDKEPEPVLFGVTLQPGYR